MADGEEDEAATVGGSNQPADAQPPASSPSLPAPVGGNHPPGPPPMPASDRVLRAWQHRSETDYIFHYWTALGWTILTLGIYGLYVFYQLVRRMRDHNARRVEILDAALTFAWEEADRRGRQEELTPSFQCLVR